MNTLCGIGLPELVIVALLGFVLIGPDRSKEFAVKAGRFLRQVMTSEWWHEFNQVSRAVQDLPSTLMRMAEIEETQEELRKTMAEIEAGTRVGLDGPLFQKPMPTKPAGASQNAANTASPSPDEVEPAALDSSQDENTASEGENADA